MAGHSKWANIKHRKGAADKKRGMIFTKLSKELTVSTRLGGSDPSANNRLRIAIAKARASNMPNDTIERAIKKGAGELEGVTYEEVLYEIYAPGGVAIIVEAVTDKKSRTTPEIKAMLNKHGGNLAEANAVRRLFEYRGYILVYQGGAIRQEQLLELAIEAGADDIREGEEYSEILTLPESFAAVSEALQQAGVEASESGIRYLPLDGTEVSVDDLDQARKLIRFLDLLEEHEDVQSVYNNMELTDEVAEGLESE